mmetsp:Transcript_8851/g.17877  ORF Transcript_8851/g.17877 Transcript_8851/m.17877 type:complete len:82 (-) Transcript_8851:417-662(-)
MTRRMTTLILDVSWPPGGFVEEERVHLRSGGGRFVFLSREWIAESGSWQDRSWQRIQHRVPKRFYDSYLTSEKIFNVMISR